MFLEQGMSRERSMQLRYVRELQNLFVRYKAEMKQIWQNAELSAQYDAQGERGAA